MIFTEKQLELLKQLITDTLSDIDDEIEDCVDSENYKELVDKRNTYQDISEVLFE